MKSSEQPNRLSIDLAGSRLSLIDEGKGPPILLGHGYLWDWRMWEPQIKALAPSNRVFVPEMWGHGQSGALPQDTRTLGDLSRHMLALLDKLEIDRCVIVGLSMGGMWGAHLAASAPDRIAGLVIMNSFLGKEPEPSRTSYGALLNTVEREGYFPQAVADVAIPLFFAADIEERSPGMCERLRNHIAAFSADQIRQSLVPLGRLIFNRDDGLGVLSRIRCPHLVITGAGDMARPPAESAAMAALLGSEPVVIADCGHTSSLEQSNEVSRILTAFLDDIGWRGTMRD